jgi:hypothetical protein
MYNDLRKCNPKYEIIPISKTCVIIKGVIVGVKSSDIQFAKNFLYFKTGVRQDQITVIKIDNIEGFDISYQNVLYVIDTTYKPWSIVFNHKKINDFVTPPDLTMVYKFIEFFNLKTGFTFHIHIDISNLKKLNGIYKTIISCENLTYVSDYETKQFLETISRLYHWSSYKSNGVIRIYNKKIRVFGLTVDVQTWRTTEFTKLVKEILILMKITGELDKFYTKMEFLSLKKA